MLAFPRMSEAQRVPMQLTHKLVAGLACIATLSGLSIPSFGDSVSQSANVDQINGNVSTIYQKGSANTASVEQQAILGGYANVSKIVQTGDHDTANVTQSGSNDKVSIAQHGANDTATVVQDGNGLAAHVVQWGNGSVNVTQSGGTVGITQSGGSFTTTGKH